MSEALAVGTKLTTLCQEGKAAEAIDALYADDVVSIEGQGSEEMPARMEGIEAIRGKTQWWFDNHEVHSMVAEGPYVGHREDQFVVHFAIDVTPKGGERMKMREVGIYTVKAAKVAQEEFLYLMA